MSSEQKQARYLQDALATGHRAGNQGELWEDATELWIYGFLRDADPRLSQLAQLLKYVGYRSGRRELRRRIELNAEQLGVSEQAVGMALAEDDREAHSA